MREDLAKQKTGQNYLAGRRIKLNTIWGLFLANISVQKKIQEAPFTNWKTITECTFVSVTNPPEKSLDVLPKEHFYFYPNIPALKEY